jgi:hypothetical protein
MSFLKAVGIDVGIVEKSLHYRIDSLDASTLAYSPVSIANWGVCGCTSLGNIQSALDTLAQVRALDVDDTNDLESRITTLESGGGSGLSNWSEDSNGHLLPSSNDTYDIGNASAKVRHFYLGSTSLKIGDANDDENDLFSANKEWFESRASTVSLGNIEVSLGNLAGRVNTLEGATDDDSAYATKVSLGQLDTRVGGLETLSAYSIATLPASANDGTQALVSDGADTGVALAYHYDRAWYRSFDNLVLADSKWSPADTTTELWYDASDLSSLTVSGTDLTQWGDKSGNGYHLTKDQNANSDAQSGTATLRGRNVIEFDSGNCLTNKNWSYDQNTAPIFIALVTKAYIDAGQDFLLHHTDSTSKRQAMRRTTANSLQWLGSDTDATSRNLSVSGYPEGDDNIIILKIGASSSYLKLLNGSGDQFTSGNTGNNPLAHISVGANEFELSQLVGYFAEIVYFKADSDVLKVEGYLAHKWGLQAYLPSDHTYKSLAP